jgi:hypothetical protein
MVALALLVHGTILGAATTIVISFREHAKFVMEMNDKCKAIVQAIRYQICEDLKAYLRPVFHGREVVRTVEILDYNGDPWITREVQPDGTEAFRNAISDFVRTNTDAVDDYRRVTRWVSIWKWWTGFTFWLALGMLLWQALAFIAIAACDKTSKDYLKDHWLLVSFTPAAIAILLFCLAQAITMMANSRIAGIANKYD